jgi:uncharacterized membrane protein YoaK (UPF0700 family)
MTPTRGIGTLGTTTRLLVGLLLVGVALTLDRPSGGVTWWDVAAVLVVLPLAAFGAVVVLNASYRRWPWLAGRTRTPWSTARPAAAVAVIAAVLALGAALTFLSPVDRVAVWLFFGLSMIVAAIRGDDGCHLGPVGITTRAVGGLRLSALAVRPSGA